MHRHRYDSRILNVPWGWAKCAWEAVLVGAEHGVLLELCVLREIRPDPSKPESETVRMRLEIMDIYETPSWAPPMSAFVQDVLLRVKRVAQRVEPLCMACGAPPNPGGVGGTVNAHLAVRLREGHELSSSLWVLLCPVCLTHAAANDWDTSVMYRHDERAL